MISKLKSCTLSGIDGTIVDVETDISQGLPGYDLVGLPDNAVKESRERVRTAIKNSGFMLPPKKITINLAPADVRKEGTHFDLPIAAGILLAGGVIAPQDLEKTLFIGELSLDGSVRRVNGVLPMVISGYEQGFRKFIVPAENAGESSLINGTESYPVSSLKELVDFLNGQTKKDPYHADIDKLFSSEFKDSPLDFSDVRGQESAKRALEIAAAGSHNILIIGPPGSGKTMMASRLPTILPDLSFAESLETTKIYSVSGLLPRDQALIHTRPFRSPHHTCSEMALIGGGRIPRPGEVSLAHNGILFMDELPEFRRSALEALRQPLEDRKITIARANGTVTYPCNFMLIAAMNPCPCGHLGDSDRCRCTESEIEKYTSRISGPLLDRFDIQIEAPAVSYQDFQTTKKTETSAQIRERVERACEIQRKRYQNDGIFFNSQLDGKLIEEYCPLGPDERNFINLAFTRMNLSGRGYNKTLKAARTIADLAQSPQITVEHLAEAIRYRNLERKYWL